ncbi:MAG: type IV secretion system DNA-binding domain-containing protein [Candidatus Daviesbacteria bacterium]|nr:type IV secretion system DNA-binding domain-containing protein [Candidatus Daviesbacteria bacterium]
MENKVVLQIQTPRTSEETPEAMSQFLSSLTNLKKIILVYFRRGIPISLEIAAFDQTIRFFIVIPKEYQTFVESQLLSQYPKAIITQVKDYLPSCLAPISNIRVARLRLRNDYIYPLKTYTEFKDVDPLSSLLGILSKLGNEEKVVIQFLLYPISNSWQNRGKGAFETKYDDLGKPIHSQYGSYGKKSIMDKISQDGFKVGVRLLVNSSSKGLLSLIAASFGSFNNPEGNSLILSRTYFYQKDRLLKAILKRTKSVIPSRQVLNLSEVATMFHLPNNKLSTISNISWIKSILSQPPDNLPIAQNLTDQEKTEINFFARTEFKNKPQIFGIKKIDRRRHIYIIGKTGTGKSTLIANMAISDIRNGQGCAIIDPHGDLAQLLLKYIPSYRVNDVIYLDPSDTSHPFHLNPLEITDPAQKELVASGIVAIFHKLYAHTWGPRLEYILRNTILTLLETPDPTLVQVPSLLTDPTYRRQLVSKLNDRILANFWLNEFEQMPPKLKSESISPILNKVGQFISSPMIRNIVGHYKSSFSFEDVMNQGKIIILNLSQGKMGEDHAALLGAMAITKMQLAAMNRVNLPEEERRDFYLYVDEFQNFATTSFIKILSESRKYRLNLILANQYTAQTPEDVRSAIFGNIGTLISFLVGAEDSRYLAREFAERFKEEDLLALGNYQMLLKLTIDAVTSSPFFAQSLPLPNSITQNKDKVIRISTERYGKKADVREINKPKIFREEVEPFSHAAPLNSIPTSGSILFSK